MVQDAYECLRTSFAFDANFSAALPDSPQCGAFSATGNTSYCQQPVCQMYSVDMAFCGQEGLVTDQSQALLVMVCTQEVQVCLDCFQVSPSFWFYCLFWGGMDIHDTSATTTTLVCNVYCKHRAHVLQLILCFCKYYTCATCSVVCICKTCLSCHACCMC